MVNDYKPCLWLYYFNKLQSEIWKSNSSFFFLQPLKIKAREEYLTDIGKTTWDELCNLCLWLLLKAQTLQSLTTWKSELWLFQVGNVSTDFILSVLHPFRESTTSPRRHQRASVWAAAGGAAGHPVPNTGLQVHNFRFIRLFWELLGLKVSICLPYRFSHLKEDVY